MKVVLGKKSGMTQVIREDGSVLATTILKVLPAYVCGVREEDGKRMVKLGFAPFKKANKPAAGQATKVLRQHKLEANGFRHLKEFDLGGVELKAGDTFGGEIFEKGEKLQITSKSKGRGFAGVIKRHNFHRGPETHGHDHHRAPGSIGAMGIARVLPGKKMPGRYGGTNVTTSGLEVLEYDAEQGLLLIKGAISGPNGSTILVKSLKDMPAQSVSHNQTDEESEAAPVVEEVQAETSVEDPEQSRGTEEIREEAPVEEGDKS